MRKIKFLNTIYPFLLIFFLSASLIKANENRIIEWIENGTLEQEKKVFKEAFSECYKDIPLKDLNIGQPNSRYQILSQFLDAAFEDEERDFAASKENTYFLHAKLGNEQIIGYASFDIEDKKGGRHAYIRQLAIGPGFERQGVGKRLVYSIIDKDPSLKRIYLVTRRVNAKAHNFYTKLGFQESKDAHEGLDPTLYAGYEKRFADTSVVQSQLFQNMDLEDKAQALLEACILQLPIADIRVSTIPIRDNQDSLVDLEGLNNPCFRHLASFPQLKISKNKDSSLVRKGLLDSLVTMLSFLPENIGIAYFEGYRPLTKQREYFTHKYRELRETGLSCEQAYEETKKYVSPFIGNIPPHCTGSAIDMTLFKIGDGDQVCLLDMGKFGTLFGPNEQSYTFCEGLSLEQRTNRSFLKPQKMLISLITVMNGGTIVMAIKLGLM